MLFGLLYEKAAGVMVVGGCTGLVPLLLWRETWLLELKHFHFFNPWLWKIPKQPKSIKLVYNHFIETSVIQELANWLRELWYFDLVGLNSRERGTNPHFTLCGQIHLWINKEFPVFTSLFQELGDQLELERISKLDYVMRTKEHKPT